MKRLNDYSWIDGGGALHLDISAMLKKMNVADTEANREEATRTAMQYFNRELPSAQMIVVDERKN